MKCYKWHTCSDERKSPSPEVVSLERFHIFRLIWGYEHPVLLSFLLAREEAVPIWGWDGVLSLKLLLPKEPWLPLEHWIASANRSADMVTISPRPLNQENSLVQKFAFLLISASFLYMFFIYVLAIPTTFLAIKSLTKTHTPRCNFRLCVLE